MKKKKYVTGLVFSIWLICFFVVYLSYMFCQSTVKPPVIDKTKIKSTELYSIDSLEKEAIKPYLKEIKDLKEKSNEKDLDIEKSKLDYKKLRKNYDSVIYRLDDYRDKIRELKNEKKNT